LDQRAKQTWKLANAQFSAALEGDLSAATVDDLRARFEPLSLAMVGVVDNFGHKRSSPLYKAHCPMAFDNKGASWLQDNERIDNPYFGSKMRRCGAIKRIYEPHSEKAQP
jgi:Cu(I)/Ag(I) efflux system membrane fusion protein